MWKVSCFYEKVYDFTLCRYKLSTRDRLCTQETVSGKCMTCFKDNSYLSITKYRSFTLEWIRKHICNYKR